VSTPIIGTDSSRAPTTSDVHSFTAATLGLTFQGKRVSSSVAA